VKVLVGCEHTGTVRRAFRERGHQAWSCDLLPASDGETFHHYQGDVLTILDQDWDLAVFHPDCTYLTNSAAWAFTNGPYHQKVKAGTLVGAARRKAREQAIDFVWLLLNAPIPRIAIENPIGALSRAIGRPQQIIQPWMFGADASKATCLWLKGLPPLEPTQIIEPRNVRGRPRWANQTDSGQNRLSPSGDRWAKRAATYPGIAAAMAEQWGG
jgi:hypothetical protein